MSPRRATPQLKKRSRLPSWLLIGGVVMVALIAVVVVADSLLKSQDTTPAISGSRTVGDARAPIAFVEFSDFQ